MNSIFSMMDTDGLTTLKIRYNYKTHTFRFFAGCEWDEDFDFSRYHRDFIIEDILIKESVFFNTVQVETLFHERGMDGYMDQIKELMVKGKHFGMDFYYHKKQDIKFIMHEHSRKRGLFNKSHGTMAGGIRRYSPETSEMQVIKDGLDLSRGMSYKNIAAGVPAGGCKATVLMKALDLENLEVMGFLAYVVDLCRNMTAPDMNLPAEMSDVMTAKKLSAQYTGGKQSKTGLTGEATAYGLVLSMKEAVGFGEGCTSLEGKKVVLIGLGAVGQPAAKYLLEEGAHVILAVRDKPKAEAFVRHCGYSQLGIIHPSEALQEAADILCPCGAGGIISKEDIPNLTCKYLWGAANNQLKTETPEDELEMAQMLADRGILYQPEWWHNCAGILCGAEEYYCDGDKNTLQSKIQKILPENTRKILKLARESGVTPTQACYDYCEKLLY